MPKLRMGLAGGGPGSFIGAVHVMAAQLDGKIELAGGVFSRDPARSAEAAAHYRVTAWPSIEAMLASGGIDFVCIATPNDSHYAIARAALNAGVHVMSDKPATLTLDEALRLRDDVKRSGRQYGLTHTYTGYPLVRDARALVASGALGAIRKVVVEYSQGWLSQPLSNKQADWRTDPAKSGLGGCSGDIGTHAFQLAEFVTGSRTVELMGDLAAVVPDRRLDDDCNILLRYANGARGVLIASQIAAGDRNGLRLRVYGEKGGLDWRQEDPNRLALHWHDGPTEVRHAGSSYLAAAASSATRLPAGHPEGYVEAFANLYRDFAVQIERGAPSLVPGIADAVRGMAFVAAAVQSSHERRWLALKDFLPEDLA
ncbi:MAG: Gfo/Idh/MocA family oxidoreductase [Asticcacaulis sp.]|nr:Gfo/Idh/MocA family oxidoreductase [Asticcacaulis sp.]